MDTKHLKSEYFKVAYSIHTPSYYQPQSGSFGFQSEAKSMTFLTDCERVFKVVGWTVKGVDATNGKSNLHLHPQQFLGIVHAELCDVVPELIAQATIFDFRIMESDSLIRFTILQRSSSVNISQPKRRRLKRNYLKHFELRDAISITSPAVCYVGY